MSSTSIYILTCFPPVEPLESQQSRGHQRYSQDKFEARTRLRTVRVGDLWSTGTPSASVRGTIHDLKADYGSQLQANALPSIFHPNRFGWETGALIRDTHATCDGGNLKNFSFRHIRRLVKNSSVGVMTLLTLPRGTT